MKIGQLIILSLIVVLFGTLFAATNTTSVANIRCDRTIISVGDPSYRLIDHCGEPEYRQLVAIEELRDRRRVGQRGDSVIFEDARQVVTEHWIYKQGRGRLIRQITVTGGYVTLIELAERQ